MTDRYRLTFVNRSNRSGEVRVFETSPDQAASKTALTWQPKIIRPGTTIMFTWSGDVPSAAPLVYWLTFESESKRIEYQRGVTSIIAVLAENDEWIIRAIEPDGERETSIYRSV